MCKKSFQTKKEIDDTTIKDVRNIFKSQKKKYMTPQLKI